MVKFSSCLEKIISTKEGFTSSGALCLTCIAINLRNSSLSVNASVNFGFHKAVVNLLNRTRCVLSKLKFWQMVAFSSL